MDVSVRSRWFKRLGMVVVFIWLTAHVAGAQFLVEYAKNDLDSKSAVSAMLQYFFLALQFLVGGITWDVLKKIKGSEIDWPNLLSTVKRIGWYFLCMLGFLVAALSGASYFGFVFAIAFVGCDVMLTKEYFSFMEQIKKGIGKL